MTSRTTKVQVPILDFGSASATLGLTRLVRKLNLTFLAIVSHQAGAQRRDCCLTVAMVVDKSRLGFDPRSFGVNASYPPEVTS